MPEWDKLAEKPSAREVAKRTASYYNAMCSHLTERSPESFARLSDAENLVLQVPDADASDRTARETVLSTKMSCLLRGDRSSWVHLLVNEIQDEGSRYRSKLIEYSPFKECLSVVISLDGTWEVIGGGKTFEEAAGAGTVALDLLYSCTLENWYGKRAGSRFRAYRIALKK